MGFRVLYRFGGLGFTETYTQSKDRDNRELVPHFSGPVPRLGGRKPGDTHSLRRAALSCPVGPSFANLVSDGLAILVESPLIESPCPRGGVLL